MRKKFIVVMLSIICCINVIGCEKKPPRGVSEEMYEVGCETVEVLDNYIDGTMTYSTMALKIESLSEEADEICEETEDEYYKDSIINLTMQHLPVISSTLFLGTADEKEHDTYEHIECRDELKELLGL